MGILVSTSISKSFFRIGGSQKKTEHKQEATNVSAKKVPPAESPSGSVTRCPSKVECSSVVHRVRSVESEILRDVIVVLVVLVELIRLDIE